jgi:hypothetical protein
VSQCAAVNPVVMTEWGFCDCVNQPDTNNVDTYGNPMLTWPEGMDGSWTARCASNSWLLDMFDANWNLWTGETQMGGFV